jgi:hypothetical protein
VTYSFEIFRLHVCVLISPIRVTCLVHLILHYVTTLLILDATWAGYVECVGEKSVVVERTEGKISLG